MKKLSYFFMSALTAVAVASCTPEEPKYYDGESLVHWSQGESDEAYVKLNSGQENNVLTYGVTAAVSGEHTVELEFVPSESTAVLGTDFTIIDGTDVISDGAVVGDFLINVKEDAAETNKVAVFQLKSNTLPLATFNQKLVVTFKLRCPLENFPLTYDVSVYAFNEYADDHVQTLVPVAGTDNKFNVASMWGNTFVAWATGNSAYLNQYLYPAEMTINCTNVIVGVSAANSTLYKGGSGTYDPTTGIIEVVIRQSLFTNDFPVLCTFYPR